ncbi:MAG: hypothetical protein KatS3mg036_0507 [Ignavibacterium sp.]|uniref:hypothetical protein n=1 Tax=Ignavibacterium sp. TaxID=2651167 RepID=UPI0021DDFB24|nr:hypothetical protein [Ignavibacterium sp.]BDQ01953.1 MAG: hypothetical protein KatS3mg037_0528 [Ignavibacterium sp.]GIV45689.1 MAG: hypothetical protein KatS3mg036_0507 [Ignavibacterium sp.]
MDGNFSINRELSIERRLATIEERLVQTDKFIDRKFSETDRKLDNILSGIESMTTRVSSLEQWRAVIKSNITLIGALVSAAITLAINFISSFLNK